MAKGEALLLIAAAVLFLGDRSSSERIVAVAPPGGAAKAFTAVKVETVYSESGEIRLSTIRTEAFRSDGARHSTARPMNAVRTEWPLPLEQLSMWDPVRRITAMILPGQGLVSSQPTPEFYERTSTPAKLCSYLIEALDRNPSSKRGEVLGYEVRQHKFGPEESQEVWVAPDLDCYEMRSTNWHIDRVSGKRYATRISEVVSVAEGEPSAEYFAIPAGFSECPPSEIFRSAWVAMDHQTGENDRQFYQQADEQYYRIKNRRD